jgi:DNA-binding PadR family transcriptional regulator
MSKKGNNTMYDTDNPRGRRGGHLRSHREHHPRRHGPPVDGPPMHHRGGRGRAARGDIRTALLLLLADEPMHGYQLMRAIADRSGGRWTASPGAVYPTISQLEDEGLVAVTADAGRKLVTLTDAGGKHVADNRDSWPDPFASFTAAGPGADLRAALEHVHSAAKQVARTGTDEQLAAALAILAETRRSLYLLLADGG